jgi:predicted secreted protein with PEFG-CTERM motif
MNYKTYALVSILITSLILVNLTSGLPSAQSKLLTLKTTDKLEYTVLYKGAAIGIDKAIKIASEDSKVDTIFHFVSTNTTSTSSNGNKTYGVRIGGKTFPIIYQITGSGNKLSNITAAKDNTTLLVNVGGSKADGKLTIQLPRNLIDSKKQGNQDSPYVIFEDSQPSQNVQEIKSNSQARTLAIDFDKGTDVIEIAGSKMLPEFGTASTIVFAIAIIGIIMASIRYKHNRLRLL